MILQDPAWRVKENCAIPIQDSDGGEFETKEDAIDFISKNEAYAFCVSRNMRIVLAKVNWVNGKLYQGDQEIELAFNSYYEAGVFLDKYQEGCEKLWNELKGEK